MNDLISRQAALDAVFNNAEHPDKAYGAIRHLPSAQTEPCGDVPDNNVGECEDAVSREAVSSWLKQYGQDVLHGKYKFSLMYIWKNLTDLPSVQIKRKNGKWIYNSPVTMKCNQCGLVIKDWDWHRFKFCPNCGADMRGGTHEQA